METVLKAIADWIKGILTAGIMSNLSGLFDDVNTQVGNIAQQVGTKPSSFEPRVFAMIEALSRNVVLPIAGIILTFIACYELIEMITQHNNMAQFEPALIMRWIFKTAVSVWLISNTFDIVMAVFDVTQKVVSDSSSIIAGNTRVNDIGLSMLQSSLMQMDVGPLFGLFLQSFFIGITMRILSIVIFVIVYGRMIEIYCMVSLAPIPMATFGNHEQSHMGQNYLKCLFALGFQGFLILICVAIYKGGKKKPPKPAVPRTAQQSIPMQRMFEDGTCRVKPNYYTRTIQYQDINYQLAQQEDKTAIFEEWCSFLNFFDSSIKFELSFVNMATDSTEFEKSIRIPFQKDGFDDVRAEYSQMLRQQLAKGNNGLTKTKFITFGVEGESMAQVKPRLDHIQNDLLNNFHRLGVQAKPLNGAQRLKLMHDMFNMDGASKFHFDWKDLVKSGLSVKDAIAPTAFAFKNSRTFQMGGIFCAANFLSITASDISDQLLKDFLDMDSSQIVTMHIQSVDQNRAIKTVKRTITELDRSKIEEQKKAIRAGYDIDIIPSDLATYGRDAKALLKELQSQNERMFLVTFLVLNTGRTEQELENNVFQASSIAQKHNCNLCRLDFQQEHGLMSSLPLADCQIEIQRGLTTSSTAIFIPFTTQELYQSGKESLYYGLNALSNNLIMVDRKKLKNPNGLILGTPGSGKSFSAKREIANAFLVTDDDIIINDPEGEYSPLVNRLKGQVIKISPNSTQFVNPMDINANYSEEDNPLSLKADFILSLCELVVGGKEGLLPVEKTVIDRCVHLIYRKYFANPCPENMPILEDLYNALLQQDEKEAHHVATALEIYVKGSLNLFNHRTNVNVNNRIVCYDIKELGKQMKKLGILKDLMNRPDVDSIVNSCDAG